MTARTSAYQFTIDPNSVEDLARLETLRLIVRLGNRGKTRKDRVSLKARLGANSQYRELYRRGSGRIDTSSVRLQHAALNGTFPIQLKKKYPDSRIVCAEIFPYYTTHLNKLGFEVVNRPHYNLNDLYDSFSNDLNIWMKENQIMKFNYGFINPPYMKGKWKKFIKDLHDRVDTQMVTISPDPSEGTGDRTEEWIEQSKRMGIQSRSDATEFFPTVQSGKISLCLYEVGKNYNPNALVRSISMESDIIKKLKTKDNDRICTRGDYEFMVTKVKGVKRNKNKDSLPNSETLTNEFTQVAIISVGKDGLTQRYFEALVGKQKVSGNGFIMNRSFGESADSPVYLVQNSEGIGFSNNVLWHDARCGETVDSFKSVFGSKLYRYYFKITKNGALDVQPRLFTDLRCPPLNKAYTDADLYSLNSITDLDMIAYIETNYE